MLPRLCLLLLLYFYVVCTLGLVINLTSSIDIKGITLRLWSRGKVHDIIHDYTGDGLFLK